MTKFNFKLNINRFINKLLPVLHKRMAKAALLIENKVKQSLSISNIGGTNPSRPGEPPHSGTGALRNSIASSTFRKGSVVVVSDIGVAKGPAAAYARRLELGFSGTDSKGRNYSQQARPFLKPAIFLNKETILKIIRKG